MMGKNLVRASFKRLSIWALSDDYVRFKSPFIIIMTVWKVMQTSFQWDLLTSETSIERVFSTHIQRESFMALGLDRFGGKVINLTVPRMKAKQLCFDH